MLFQGKDYKINGDHPIFSIKYLIEKIGWVLSKQPGYLADNWAVVILEFKNTNEQLNQ